jgi:N-acetylmuramoyl-L-alanine amidase
MGVVPYTEAVVILLTRLLRAEAEGEGNLSMSMVGNTGVNRVRSKCLDFKDISPIRKMVFQSPGGFEATQKGSFYQRARENELNLASKVIKGQRFHPAQFSVWFFKPAGTCPTQWFNQRNAGPV